METTTHLDVATRQPQCRSRHQHISFKTSIVDRSLTSFVMVRLPSSEMTEIGLSLLAAQSRSNPREPPGQKASFIDRKRTQTARGTGNGRSSSNGNGSSSIWMHDGCSPTAHSVDSSLFPVLQQGSEGEQAQSARQAAVPFKRFGNNQAGRGSALTAQHQHRLSSQIELLADALVAPSSALSAFCGACSSRAHRTLLSQLGPHISVVRHGSFALQ